MTTSPRRRHASAVKKVGFVCALAAAVAPLLSYVHEATVPHLLCPEHGEPMESPPSDRVETPAPMALSHSELAQDARPRPGPHRHCALVPQRLQPVLGVPTPQQSECVFRVASAASSSPRASLQTAELLLFAPKTSPPL